MALTRDFKETIRARVVRDAKFRRELLREGIESMLAGDIATAKVILRDYINATVGFTDLAEVMRISPKSLMRMLGPLGIRVRITFSGSSATSSIARACASRSKPPPPKAQRDRFPEQQ